MFSCYLAAPAAPTGTGFNACTQNCTKPRSVQKIVKNHQTYFLRVNIDYGNFLWKIFQYLISMHVCHNFHHWLQLFPLLLISLPGKCHLIRDSCNPQLSVFYRFSYGIYCHHFGIPAEHFYIIWLLRKEYIIQLFQARNTDVFLWLTASAFGKCILSGYCNHGKCSNLVANTLGNRDIYFP